MDISNIRNLVMQCAFLSNFHWLLLGVPWVPWVGPGCHGKNRGERVPLPDFLFWGGEGVCTKATQRIVGVRGKKRHDLQVTNTG